MKVWNKKLFHNSLQTIYNVVCHNWYKDLMYGFILKVCLNWSTSCFWKSISHDQKHMIPHWSKSILHDHVVCPYIPRTKCYSMWFSSNNCIKLYDILPMHVYMWSHFKDKMAFYITLPIELVIKCIIFKL